MLNEEILDQKTMDEFFNNMEFLGLSLEDGSKLLNIPLHKLKHLKLQHDLSKDSVLEFTHEAFGRVQSLVVKDDLSNLYPKYNCLKCGMWFHMPYKNCNCEDRKPAQKVGLLTKFTNWFTNINV